MQTWNKHIDFGQAWITLDEQSGKFIYVVKDVASNDFI